jgi:hypothetical protein
MALSNPGSLDSSQVYQMLTVPSRIASVGVGALTITSLDEGVWVGSATAVGESQALQALSHNQSERQVDVMRSLITASAVFIHSPANDGPIPWTVYCYKMVFVQIPDIGK